METLYSFAQEYEDIILYHILKNVNEPIRYIDVGANDPTFLSVTKFFSLRGGGGVNVEPQHDLIEKLKADRPDDINLEAGISDKPGKLTLYGTGTGASFDGRVNHDKATKEIPMVTLADVCKQFFSAQKTIHFLKIDVEGFEKQCLDGMDFKAFRPWVVCMESTEPGTDIPAWESWENVLLSQGYVFVGMNGINRYYVAEEAQKDLNDFCDAKKLREQYVIYFASSAMPGEREKREAELLSHAERKIRHLRRGMIGLSVALVAAVFYILTAS